MVVKFTGLEIRVEIKKGEGRRRSTIEARRSNPLTCEEGRAEVVRCDSAGSAASGWENETLPVALNRGAGNGGAGSDSGMARLLSKPKPGGGIPCRRRKQFRSKHRTIFFFFRRIFILLSWEKQQIRVIKNCIRLDSMLRQLISDSEIYFFKIV